MGIVRASMGAAGAVVLVLAVAGSRVAAVDPPAPGTPDSAFGTGGTATGAFAGTLAMDGILRQADGRLIVVGTVGSGPGGTDAPYAFALTRLDVDGGVDAGFGVDGRVTTSLGDDGLALPFAAALQSDGSILVGGGVSRSGVIRADLVRYTPDGDLDPTFGVDGLVELDLAAGGYIDRIVVGAGDAITLAGAADESDREWMLARLSADGAPDPGFGTDGIVLTGEPSDGGYGMAVAADGGVTASNGSILARYDAAGSPDAAFGVAGVVPGPFGDVAGGGLVAVVADGGGDTLLVAGREPAAAPGDEPRMALARYDATGALDPSFGVGGVAAPDLGAVATSDAQDLVLDATGRIVVVGRADGAVVVARLTTDGSLDAAFGPGGFVLQAFGSQTYPDSVVLDPDGAVLVGASNSNLLPSVPWTVTRLLGDPTPPATVPGAPTSVTATATGGDADVTWSAPASDGGSPITGYSVTESPGGGTCSTDGELGCTVPSLADGSHRFTVVASNAVGSGAASDPSPVLVIDTTAPSTPGVPAVSLVAGSTLDATVPVSVSWTASTDATGVDGYELWLSTDGGVDVLVASPAVPTAAWPLSPGASSVRFRVRAVDAAGNASAFSDGSPFRVRRVEQTSSRVRYSGRWDRVRADAASGGSYERTSVEGRSAALTFDGRAVAVVVRTDPSFGAFRVLVDGVRVARVAEGDAAHWRRLVFATGWASAGRHTLTVVCAGTAGHPRITLDAFVVLE